MALSVLRGARQARELEPTLSKAAPALLDQINRTGTALS